MNREMNDFVREFLDKKSDIRDRDTQNREEELNDLEQTILATIVVWCIRTRITQKEREEILEEATNVLREKMLRSLDECVRERPADLLQTKEDIIIRVNQNFAEVTKRLKKALL